MKFIRRGYQIMTIAVHIYDWRILEQAMFQFYKQLEENSASQKDAKALYQKMLKIGDNKTRG